MTDSDDSDEPPKSLKSSIEIYSLVNELYCKTKVTQKLKNESKKPLEIKVFLDAHMKYILTSFTAKIGDSIEVKSKLIKKTKAEEKYTDSISSGNAAIYVSYEEYNEKYIINMGNVPPKQELIFISEYIQYIESSDLYELELFRNLPIIMGKEDVIQNSEIKGTVEIKTNFKISKVMNIILSKQLKINEEKYTNENNCEYLIKYEYKDLKLLKRNYNNDYIPSNKIFFEVDNNAPIAFYQKSPKNNEINYIIQYRNIPIIKNDENESDINPSLFFFLLDQSYSMEGYLMDVAIKALILFLQSLPAGSYYQIIGFGSKYEKYDKVPKEYTQENIKESIKFLQTLKANKGTTDIYSPLKDIYDSGDYSDIKLPRNIFLLTDGEIDNRSETLKLIENNNYNFAIYAIGIGKEFDKDLIKNAGILGKGNFNFCSDINYLKQTIIKEIKNSSKQFLYNCELNSNLDEINLYQIEDKNIKIPILKENRIVNMKYIIEDSKDENEIKINLKYSKTYDKELNEELINEILETKKIEIKEGNELGQLIMNEYLSKNKNKLTEEEEAKLALKYQLLTEETSLFAQIELSEKITEEMKKEIISKDDEVTYYYDRYQRYKRYEKDDEEDLEYIPIKVEDANRNLEMMNQEAKHQGGALYRIEDKIVVHESIETKETIETKEKKSGGVKGFFKSVGKSIKGILSKKKKNNNINELKNEIKNKNSIYTNINTNIDINTKINNSIKDNINNNNITLNKNDKSNNNINKIVEDNNNKEKSDINNIENNKNENKVNDIDDDIDDNEDENSKEININKIVNEQNFVEGFWEINKKTEKIKEKYENEFKSLKEIKDKNINDNIAITILIIYYIKKEHSELLGELELIIQKAKKYIKKNINDTYENIIKEIGI